MTEAGGGAVLRHLVARGRVQGVGYRAFVASAAMAAGLSGWVRNRRDGSVEALLAGAEEAVEEVVSACRRGPPMARVDGLDLGPGAPDLLDLRPAGEAFAVLATL
jgi:acylphosphatase